MLIISALPSFLATILPLLHQDDDLSRDTGLLHPLDHPMDRENDLQTKLYLETMRSESVPASFDARAHGWVSSPGHQKSCGSCVVFTNIAIMETCIAMKECGADPADCRVPDLREVVKNSNRVKLSRGEEGQKEITLAL